MKNSYEHAGGEEALHRVEELFYSKVLADPTLRTLFTERRPHHVDHLTWFTAESFGGPDRFTRELGFQHIIDAHRNAQKNSWAETEADLHPIRRAPHWQWPSSATPAPADEEVLET